MRFAAIISTAMLAILMPDATWQQSAMAELSVPSPVKLADLDPALASVWRSLTTFPVTTDYVLVPKPMGNDGQANRDFAVVSSSGSPKGQASLSLFQSENAATLYESILEELMYEDQSQETTLSASPSPTSAPGSATCLTASNKTTNEKRIACYVVRGAKLFVLNIAAPAGPVSAALIAETKGAAEAAAGFSDAFTSSAMVASAPAKPDPATAAATATPSSDQENSTYQAVTLASLNAKSQAAFEQTKTYIYDFGGGYGVTDNLVSASATYAEYTRTLAGPGVDPASTIEYRIYEDQLTAMMFAGQAGSGYDAAWLPASHGPVETYKTASGNVDHDGDVDCFSSPLTQLGKILARCFTAKDKAAVSVTLILNAGSDDAAKANIQIAANLASVAAKTFQEAMDSLKK